MTTEIRKTLSLVGLLMIGCGSNGGGAGVTPTVTEAIVFEQSVRCLENAVDPEHIAGLQIIPESCGGGTLRDVSLCGGEEGPCVVRKVEQFPTGGSQQYPPIGRMGPLSDFFSFAVVNGELVMISYEEGHQKFSPPASIISDAHSGDVLGQDVSSPTILGSGQDEWLLSSLWVLDPTDGWRCISTLFDLEGHQMSPLLRDAGGCLHGAAHGHGDSGFVRATFDGEWSVTSVTNPEINTKDITESPKMAMGPTGVPQAIFQTLDHEYQLFWQWGDNPVEPLPKAYFNLMISDIQFAVAPSPDDDPIGQPQVFFGTSPKQVGDAANSVLRVYNRTGNQSWSQRSLLEVDTTQWSTCPNYDGDPYDPATTCDLNYWEYKSLGIAVTARGDIRYIYSGVHHTGTLQSHCTTYRATPNSDLKTGYPLPCSYSGDIHNDGKVGVAWFDEKGIAQNQIIEGLIATNPTAGNVVVDGEGSMHLSYMNPLPENGSGIITFHNILVDISTAP